MSYQGNTPLTRFLATQTLGELRKMKADARNEIEAARSRVDELESDLARIEQAIAEKAGGRRGATVTEPTSNGRGGQPKPSMKEAIVALLREQPEATWTTQDVFDELLKHSLAPGGAKPLNTVGNRLVELARDGRIHKRGRGAYSLTPSRANDSFAPPSEDGERD